MNSLEELARLRADQKIVAEHFHGPLKDWYHNEGAWAGITDLLLEECFILIELDAVEKGLEIG